MLLEKFLDMRRRYKRILQLLIDVVLIWLSLWLTFFVRLGADSAWAAFNEHLWLLWVAPLVSLPVFIRLGMYRAVLRYLGQEAFIEIFKAVSLAALLLSVAVHLYHSGEPPVIPRSFVFIYWVVSLLCIGGLRLLIRQFFRGELLLTGQILFPFLNRPKPVTRVAVYGAGEAGNQLVTALRMSKRMEPVAFIDDDDRIATCTIAGLKVYKPKHIKQMLKLTGASEILLAIPSTTAARRSEILAHLEPYPVHVRSVPGIMDLASGRVKVQDLQEVDIADLLGRDTVTPEQTLFERCIKGHVVMVTGAGGSIGAELCRQILASGATTLILYEHSEFNLYAISQELERRVQQEGLCVQVLPILGSVRSKKRLLEVMRRWPVKTLYHAAAYKHVPIVEHNTAEGIRNNVMGTLYTAQAAIVTGVAHFVLVSTDKAVRPTSVMGSSKRLAEMVLQALSQEQQVNLLSDSADEVAANHTCFSMVRFGNVLDSSGSVIPLFREQIRRGGPVTVTHPDMTRYFMTITEAAQLVIQAGALGQGGDVFVLNMGEPVKILAMAEKMIHLTGLSVRTEDNPLGEIAIEFSGLRPGEKLFEELLIGDNASATEHPMIKRANEEYLAWPELSDVLRHLLQLVEQGNSEAIRQLLCETVNGYSPQGEIIDLVYQQDPSD